MTTSILHTSVKEKSPRRKKKSGKHCTKRIMLPLPEDVYRHLQELAERNNRPLGWEARGIIVEYLKTVGLWPPPDKPKE